MVAVKQYRAYGYASFHGGPWDGQTRWVQIRDHLEVPIEPPPVPVMEWRNPLPTALIEYQVARYRCEQWVDDSGTEFRYYVEAP